MSEVQSLPLTGTYRRLLCQFLPSLGVSMAKPFLSTQCCSPRTSTNLLRPRTYGSTNSPASFIGLGRLKSAPAVGAGMGGCGGVSAIVAPPTAAPASPPCAATCACQRSRLSSLRSRTRLAMARPARTTR